MKYLERFAIERMLYLLVCTDIVLGLIMRYAHLSSENLATTFLILVGLNALMIVLMGMMYRIARKHYARGRWFKARGISFSKPKDY